MLCNEEESILQMSSRETVKILLLKRNMTITELAKRLTDLSGKKYSRSSLSTRISRNAIKYCEMEQIAKILDFKIQMVDLTDE